MPTVRIPTPLRNLTDGQNRVEAEASTVAKLLQRLDEAYPGFSQRLIDEQGELRRFVNIYVDGEDIRFRKGLETALSDVKEVSIVPSVSGGL